MFGPHEEAFFQQGIAQTMHGLLTETDRSANFHR
jgi:hypothetical protein